MKCLQQAGGSLLNLKMFSSVGEESLQCTAVWRNVVQLTAACAVTTGREIMSNINISPFNVFLCRWRAECRLETGGEYE